jgi:hypothetical protein
VRLGPGLLLDACTRPSSGSRTASERFCCRWRAEAPSWRVCLAALHRRAPLTPAGLLLLEPVSADAVIAILQAMQNVRIPKWVEVLTRIPGVALLLALLLIPLVLVRLSSWLACGFPPGWLVALLLAGLRAARLLAATAAPSTGAGDEGRESCTSGPVDYGLAKSCLNVWRTASVGSLLCLFESG